MSIARSLQDLRDRLSPSARMPVVFLGHGSPMNAIQDTAFSRLWTDLGIAYLRLGELERAVSQLEQARRLAPTNTQVLLLGAEAQFAGDSRGCQIKIIKLGI